MGLVNVIEQGTIDAVELQRLFEDPGVDPVIEYFPEVERVLRGDDPPRVEGIEPFKETFGKGNEIESVLGTGVGGNDGMAPGTGENRQPPAPHQGCWSILTAAMASCSSSTRITAA